MARIIKTDNCRTCPFSDWPESTTPFNCKYYNKFDIEFDFTQKTKPEFCNLVLIKMEEKDD